MNKNVKENVFVSFFKPSENKLMKKLQNIIFFTVFVRCFEKDLKKLQEQVLHHRFTNTNKN